VYVNFKVLIEHQTHFIGFLMGGPKSFSDEHLYKAHQHLNIDENEWLEVTRLLKHSLDEFGIEPQDADIIMQSLIEKKALILQE
jgi:hemoglobin